MLIKNEFATMGVCLSVLQHLPIDGDANFQVDQETVEKEGNRSYASILLENSDTKHLVGKTGYFISYAWKGQFRAALGCTHETV